MNRDERIAAMARAMDHEDDPPEPDIRERQISGGISLLVTFPKPLCRAMFDRFPFTSDRQRADWDIEQVLIGVAEVLERQFKAPGSPYEQCEISIKLEGV